MIKKLILTSLFCLIPLTCFAEIWAFLLANDTPQPHRKKEGDIIAVRSADWRWGSKERRQYLVVLVDFENVFTDINDVEKLKIPYYSKGNLKEQTIMPGTKPFDISGKRRFKISFTDIDNLAKGQGIAIDWNKVKNEELDYQPLLEQGIVFSYQDLVECKHTKRKLKAEDLKVIKNAGKKNAKTKLDN